MSTPSRIPSWPALLPWRWRWVPWRSCGRWTSRSPLRPGLAGTLLLWIYAVCFFAVGFFPTDEFPTVNPPSWHGIIHAILGLISFACFSAGSLLVSLRLRREPAWQNTAPALTSPLSALCVASFFVFYGGLEEVMGLIERIYAALIVAWLALAAAKLRAGASETAAAADSRGPSADR